MVPTLCVSLPPAIASVESGVPGGVVKYWGLGRPPVGSRGRGPDWVCG